MCETSCRACLESSSELIDMSASYYKDEIPLVDIFVDCTNVFLNEGFLCRLCETRLLDWYEFRLQAQQSESVLNSLKDLEEEFVVEYLEDDEDAKTLEENPMPIREQNTKVCRYCLQFVTEELSVHEQLHITRNEGLECHHCHKKYSSRKRIVEHLKVVHFRNKFDRPRFECEICEKSFSEKSSLRTHQRDIHSDNPRLKKKEICPICGKRTAHLQKHIDSVHRNVICCYCDQCGKGFKSKAALTNHLKYLHLGVREAQCAICMKYYRNSTELDFHIKSVHTTEQKYECLTCGTKFKTEASHRVHVRLHQTDFLFKCDVCDARFKTKHYMLSHMKVHSDVKTFQCTVCSMSFKRSGQLTRHLRKHNGDLFKCELCPKSEFNDKFSLKEHNEQMHLGVRYRCDTCAKIYQNRKHLRQHQKSQNHDVNFFTKIIPTDDCSVEKS
ncbi:zinc finger protein 26-like [Culicoides brevitarsis]|uniref:zinc finger protein 26-like n=1 Tax=Culicoides brevitarsis TaxID=469753 RepID=UPI00307B5FA9